MPNGHGRTVPTMQELKRGIYLDFEGNMNQQPTLLGTMKDDQSDFVIVEEVFKDCAGRTGSPCRYAPLDSSLRTLIEVAHEEDRRIIAWSEHDFRIMKEHLEDEHQSLLETCYVNAIFPAKRWRALKRPDDQGPNTLGHYMSLLGWNASSTETDAVALSDPLVAVIVAVPSATEVTRPVDDNVATEVSDVAHVTVGLGIVSPFASVTVAVS